MALGRRINSISRPPARLPVTETCNLVYLPVLVSGLTIHMQLQTYQNYDQGSSFVAYLFTVFELLKGFLSIILLKGEGTQFLNNNYF